MEYDYAKASALAISLGMTTISDYKKRCHEFSELPLYPETVFKKIWTKSGCWRGFLGKKVKNFYSSFDEASFAAQKLGISNCVEYRFRHKEDSRLPGSPYFQYRSEWDEKGAYSGFFNQKKLGIRKVFYSSWEEASAAAIKLGIGTYHQYRKMYKNDSFLPSKPQKIYKAKWSVNGKWNGFLASQGDPSQRNPSNPNNPKYATYREACKAAMKLGTSTYDGYRKKYKIDTKLPSHPEQMYSKEWIINGRWLGFLRGWCFREDAPELELLDAAGHYKNYEDASKASRKLGIVSAKHYEFMRRMNPYLCRSPEKQFSDRWKDLGGWPGFLGTERHYYKSVADMKKAVRKLNISSSNEYRKRYTEDKKLHRLPHLFYGKKWIKSGRWLYIFDRRARNGTILSYYSSLEAAAVAARILNIKSRKEYRTRYKEDPRLPSTPETTYAQAWKKTKGWRGFLNTSKNAHINKYMAIQDAANASKKLGFKSAAQYRSGYQIDPLLPCAPDQFYKDDWEKAGKWSAFTI